MKKISLITTFVLWVISFAWFILDFLALTDIFHGREPDLSGEWTIVSYSVIPLTLFFVSTLVMLILFRNNGRKEKQVS